MTETDKKRIEKLEALLTGFTAQAAYYRGMVGHSNISEADNQIYKDLSDEYTDYLKKYEVKNDRRLQKS